MPRAAMHNGEPSRGPHYHHHHHPLSNTHHYSHHHLAPPHTLPHIVFLVGVSCRISCAWPRL